MQAKKEKDLEKSDIEAPKINQPPFIDPSNTISNLPLLSESSVFSSKPSKVNANPPKMVTIVDYASPRQVREDSVDMSVDESIMLPSHASIKSNQLLSVASVEEPVLGNQIVPKELSMIAEDEEPFERSNMSVSPIQIALTSTDISVPPSTSPESTPEVQTIPLNQGNIDHLGQQSRGAMEDVLAEFNQPAQQDNMSSLVETFQSVPLVSFEPSLSGPTTLAVAQEALQSEIIVSQPSSLPDANSTSGDSMSPSATMTAMKEDSDPVRDEALIPGPSHARKPNTSQFSNLPAPSPLRKSMRFTREPSVDVNVALPPPTTAPMVGGKRSSWLVKAREAKALEGVGRKTGTFDVGPSHLNAKKRKSAELGREEASVASQATTSRPGMERSSKQQRLSDEDEPPALQKAKGKDIVDVDMHQTAVAEQGLTRPHPDEYTDRQFMEDFTVPLPALDSEGNMLANLKRTVQGLGARAGKSMGKSLGGNAAAALAEARAAAEARIAERNRTERGSSAETSEVDSNSAQPNAFEDTNFNAPDLAVHAPSPKDSSTENGHPRLSVSDLVTSLESKGKSRSPPVVPSRLQTPSADTRLVNTSTSTTPPNSPPPPPQNNDFMAPPEPVFKKPPVVFVAPSATTSVAPGDRAVAASSSKEFAFKLPATNPFSIPAAMALGLPASFPSSSGQPSSQSKGVPLSAQSSKASMFSDTVFDREDSMPAWMPATQDTDYPTQVSENKAHDTDFEDDDSWHVDEKFASNQMWTPFGFVSADKDDSMTWSTLPSRSTSQKGGETDAVPPSQNFGVIASESKRSPPDNAIVETDQTDADGDARMDSDLDETDLMDADIGMDGIETESDLDAVLQAGKSTVSLVGVSIDPVFDLYSVY